MVSSIIIFDQSFQRSCIDCEPTIPQDKPKEAIDFIAFDKKHFKKVKILKHLVINETYASDHRPVYAEVFIKD